MVYVLNQNGQPLMPTENHAKVRVLLKQGKAKVVNKCPFTKIKVLLWRYQGEKIMSKSKKWLVTKQSPEDPLYAVFFTARNKDNKDIEGFMQRKRSFLYHIPDIEHIPETVKKRFEQFVNEGIPGELSRMYVSINPRDPVKIKRELMHELIDDRLPTKTPLAHMDTVVVSIGMRKGMSTTRHWMFDFDSENEELLHAFISNIEEITGQKPTIHKTPHGYAVICERGFDMRKLGGDWDEYITDEKQERIITLKRDDLLCVDWSAKHDK